MNGNPSRTREVHAATRAALRLHAGMRRLWRSERRLLVVHARPSASRGGAELNLDLSLADPPPPWRVEIVAPDADPDIKPYDAIVIANIRPPGGAGERAEYQWAETWTRRLERFGGIVIRSEHDIHPCAMRDGRCIGGDPLRRDPCSCGRAITNAFQNLFDRADAVRTLSPGHREVIGKLVAVRGREYVIASPVDFTAFAPRTPVTERAPVALAFADAVRHTDEQARELARQAGLALEVVPYLSVPQSQMPALLNSVRAVVMAPVAYHAFGRLAVEALACGCQVLTNGRVGAFTWPDPVAAARRARSDFWAMIQEMCP